MDFKLPKQKYDLDAWLTEDFTAEFDRIVSQRKRHRAIRRWAVAAALVGAILAIGFMAYDGTPTQTVSLPKAKPELAQNQKQVAQNQEPSPYPANVPERQPRTSKKARNKSKAGKGSTDSLQYYIAKLEQELNHIGDSLNAAQEEQILKADARLQQLVKQILLDRIAPDGQPLESLTSLEQAPEE